MLFRSDLPRKLDAGLLAISGLLPSMARPTGMGTTANRPPLITGPRKAVGNMVLIEAIPMRGATTLSADLASLGFQQARQNNGVVAGWLPTNSVVQLERVPSLRLARSILATTRLGRVTAQNDIALRAPAARGTFGVSGRGKRVGILSDSFNSLGGMAGGIASNDLPASIDIISDPLDRKSTRLNSSHSSVSRMPSSA